MAEYLCPHCPRRRRPYSHKGINDHMRQVHPAWVKRNPHSKLLLQPRNTSSGWWPSSHFNSSACTTPSSSAGSSSSSSRSSLNAPVSPPSVEEIQPRVLEALPLTSILNLPAHGCSASESPLRLCLSSSPPSSLSGSDSSIRKSKKRVTFLLDQVGPEESEYCESSPVHELVEEPVFSYDQVEIPAPYFEDVVEIEPVEESTAESAVATHDEECDRAIGEPATLDVVEELNEEPAPPPVFTRPDASPSHNSRTPPALRLSPSASSPHNSPPHTVVKSPIRTRRARFYISSSPSSSDTSDSTLRSDGSNPGRLLGCLVEEEEPFSPTRPSSIEAENRVVSTLHLPVDDSIYEPPRAPFVEWRDDCDDDERSWLPAPQSIRLSSRLILPSRRRTFSTYERSRSSMGYRPSINLPRLYTGEISARRSLSSNFNVPSLSQHPCVLGTLEDQDPAPPVFENDCSTPHSPELPSAQAPLPDYPFTPDGNTPDSSPSTDGALEDDLGDFASSPTLVNLPSSPSPSKQSPLQEALTEYLLEEDDMIIKDVFSRSNTNSPPSPASSTRTWSSEDERAVADMSLIQQEREPHDKAGIELESPFMSPKPVYPRMHCRACLRDPPDSLTATMCGHIFCYSCIADAVIKTSRCPTCQAPTLLYCLFRLDLSV